MSLESASNFTQDTFNVACSDCTQRNLCMPIGFNSENQQKLNQVVATRCRVNMGEMLFRNGDKLTSIFAISTGSFKTTIKSESGRAQVSGFHMAGDILGLDGIINDQYNSNAIALEDAEVCVMPFANVEALSREFPILQRHVHKAMSREIVRVNSMMSVLGDMRAEKRVASFLLSLAQRLNARGLSQSEITLKMKREEIASYLGLKIETVSRTFSKFAEERIIEVKQRRIRVINPEALRIMFN